MFVVSSCFLNVVCIKFMHLGVQHNFHIRRCSCNLTLARRLSRVEQVPLTLPEHLSSPPVFIGIRVVRSVDFYIVR